MVKGLSYLDGKPISIAIKDGKIAKIESISKEAHIQKLFIAPGLVDLQVNGFMGIDFSDQKLSIAGIREATIALWKTGVTTFLPTLTTNANKYLKKSFSILAAALHDEIAGLSIPGFHLEGPYISPLKGFRGAHLEKYIRPPDWNEFLELQAAAQNGIRLITLAPELQGAISFIKKCRESGVIVSLGHHNGSRELIRDAINAGASMSTHLGNGCSNMINRHENPLWPQLADDRLAATIIADGFHLNKEEVQCFFKMKGKDRTILVSDTLSLAGLPPGDYIQGEKSITVTPDVAKYPLENVLAGAIHPLNKGISNCMKFTGCTLGDAIGLASTSAARCLGLTNIGVIKDRETG